MRLPLFLVHGGREFIPDLTLSFPAPNLVVILQLLPCLFMFLCAHPHLRRRLAVLAVLQGDLPLLKAAEASGCLRFLGASKTRRIAVARIGLGSHIGVLE